LNSPNSDAERGGEEKMFEPYLTYGENIFSDTDNNLVCLN